MENAFALFNLTSSVVKSSDFNKIVIRYSYMMFEVIAFSGQSYMTPFLPVDFITILKQ